MHQNFLDRNYNERQLIIDVPNPKEIKDSDSNWLSGSEVTGIAVGAATSLIPGGLVAKGIASIGILAANELFKNKNPNRKTNNHNHKVGLTLFKDISENELSQIKFPLFHPRKDTVYIAHPLNKYSYYTLANFHQAIVEHKFSEISNILANLGAKSINVFYNNDNEKKIDGCIGVTASLANEKAGGGLNGGNSRSHSNNIAYSAEYNGHNNPKLPGNTSWLAHEQMWQHVVDQRINHGLKKFELNLNIEEDFNINAKLVADIKMVNIEIGGEFQNFKKTSWKITGEFG